MRRLLLALPFALLPLAMAHAADDHDHDHEHSSLAPHEHGVGSLNVALDGQTLELDLDGPSMNLVALNTLLPLMLTRPKSARYANNWKTHWCCSASPRPPVAQLKRRN